MPVDVGACFVRPSAVLIWLLLTLVQGIGAGQSQTPTFRAGIELVTLDVTVLSKDGKTVTGLSPADFSIKLSGQVRKVELLEYVSFDAAAAVNASAPQAAAHHSASVQPRTIIVVIDDLAAQPGQLKRLVDGAGRMLASLRSSDLVGAMTTSSETAPIRPTAGKSAVHGFLKSVAMAGRRDDTPAGVFIGVEEAIEIDSDVSRDALLTVAQRECVDSDMGSAPGARGRAPAVDEECARRLRAVARMQANHAQRTSEQQVAAIVKVLDALRSAPRPRIVILLSTGLALHERQDMGSLLDRVSRAAAEAEVQLLALVEVTDGIEMKDRVFGRARARQAQNRFLTSGLQTLATAAGGEAFPVVGETDRFFDRIARQTAGMYRLSVEVPASPRVDGLLDVEVKVHRRDVRVLTRRQVIRR